MSENISFNSAELGAPVETLGYEQARAELEQVVRQLESGARRLPPVARHGCRARRSA